MRCLLESPAAACKQLKSFRAAGVQTLTCRAHNHRKPDTSRWYVVPSAEWPPYAHAMFFADWDPDQEGAIRLGALVCRGLGPRVTAELTRPAGQGLVLQRHWRWRDIVLEYDSELLIEAAVTSAANLEAALHLQVAATRVPAGVGADPYEGKRVWDRVVLKLDASGKLEPVSEQLDLGALDGFIQANDVDAFAAALRAPVKDDWVWTDVTAFNLVQPPEKQASRKRKKDTEPLVTTHELYESMMLPFESWLFDE